MVTDFYVILFKDAYSSHNNFYLEITPEIYGIPSTKLFNEDSEITLVEKIVIVLGFLFILALVIGVMIIILKRSSKPKAI